MSGHDVRLEMYEMIISIPIGRVVYDLCLLPFNHSCLHAHDLCDLLCATCLIDPRPAAEKVDDEQDDLAPWYVDVNIQTRDPQ